MSRSNAYRTEKNNLEYKPFNCGRCTRYPGETVAPDHDLTVLPALEDGPLANPPIPAALYKEHLCTP